MIPIRSSAICFPLLLVFSVSRCPAAGPQAYTDQTTYNAGATVRIKVPLSGGAESGFTASIRYAGESQPVARKIHIPASAATTYTAVWQVPGDARTGRYQIDLAAGPGTIFRNAASFAVHRKLVQINLVEVDRAFYTADDDVACRIVITNVSGHPMTGLRVEFAPYYFPWIAQPADEPPIHPTVVVDSLSLAAGAGKELRLRKGAVAWAGKEPGVNYYSAVIWDHARSEIYDFALTQPFFVHPAGVDLPKPYPYQYTYPKIESVVKAMAYRQFYPPEFVSDSIAFDRDHTMFATGAAPVIRFKLTNSSGATWRSVRKRVLRADGSVLSSVEAPARDIPAQGLQDSVTAPALPPGLYQMEVAVLNESGDALARNRIEFAVNEMPKSILVFGAHQDDDTAHPGTIRAAVENGIPIHFVYFTAGDAGNCDRFYSRGCDASRALNFGEVRMSEARASLGHLGVPPGNIFFLGLPDGGSEEIWYRHIRTDQLYLSVLLASDHSPYAEAAVPNLPYARNAVIEAAKNFIRKYQPEVIVTSHPDERHVDHRTDNWFVVKALQELLRDHAVSPATRVLVDQSYGPDPKVHAPYRYGKQVLHVSGEAARIGQEASWYYQTQDGSRLQGAPLTYSQLPREEVHWWILDWAQHEGWNEARTASARAAQ